MLDFTKCGEPVVQHSTVISWQFVVCQFKIALAQLGT